uniref:EEF1A lysine methyltransferase 3-like n=1 Tax=Pristiophorus japonicus TaxID=55135 RepID=UPI00398E835D
MESLLKSIPGTVVFQDEILLTGKDTDSHLRNLEEVLKRLDRIKLMVFPDQSLYCIRQRLTSSRCKEAAWRSRRVSQAQSSRVCSERTMQAQPGKQHSSSPGSKEELSKLESRYLFCGNTLKITRDFSSNLGISAIIWEAGLVLCSFFEQEKISFSGKKVIELGSGTGIVGILAILLGGEVTLTDQPIVLNQIEFNIDKNIPAAIKQHSKVSALRWGENQDQFPTDYDVILGSDIVYSPQDFPSLLRTLRHLSNANTVIYICSKMRESMGAMNFHNKLVPQHFNSEIVHRNEDKEINVYKVTKKGPSVVGQPQV